MAFFAAIIALTALFIWQGYRDGIARGLVSAEVAAHAVGEHARWITEASTQALRRIDETLGARPELIGGGEVADIDDAIASLPAGVFVRVFDTEGKVLLSSDPAEGALDIADRDYFRRLREGQSWDISPLITDRAGKRQVFAIGRRLERQGAFAGVAVILIPASLVTEFWSALGLGPGSAASIIRDDGWLVARHPVPEEAVDLSSTQIFTEHLASGSSGSYLSERSPTDGVARLVGYRRVEGLPIVAVAAISTDTALADHRTRLLRVGLGGLPVLMALTGLAWWVSSLLSREEARQRELERAVDQNRLLFREVHHRVKNNLQTVASLIQLQDIPPDAKRDLRGRISAMASVHEQIYRSDHLGEIKLDEYLRGILEGLRGGHPAAVDISFRSDPVILGPDQAMAVGLIVTELVSNSFKHGFSDGRSGRLTLLVEQRDGKARIAMTDNGRPFDPTVPTKGLGIKLVRSFAAQLHADYDISGEDGLRFEMTFPISREEA